MLHYIDTRQGTNNKHSRITSYNVCYTKLLRIPGALPPDLRDRVADTGYNPIC